jgi:hypothetical protein
MKRPVDEPPAAKSTTTVLDRVRPTVVVRRRVYEPERLSGPSGAPSLLRVGAFTQADDDESGPPSSSNVARALASLRGDELRRLEQILSDDDGPASDAPRAAVASVPTVALGPTIAAVPSVPTVALGPTIAVAELARRMNVPVHDLVTSLVTRGFFSVTVKASLPRETARTAANLYGWQVEETDEVELAPAKKRSAAPKARVKAPASKVKDSAATRPARQAHAPQARKKKTGTRSR